MDERSAALLEVLDRLSSVRRVVDAVMVGEWPSDEPETLDALAALVDSAASWARRAAA